MSFLSLFMSSVITSLMVVLLRNSNTEFLRQLSNEIRDTTEALVAILLAKLRLLTESRRGRLNVRDKQQQQPRIDRPPGRICRLIADVLFSRRTRERIFYQVIADTQQEYYEALAAGRHRMAQWLKVRGGIYFIVAVLAYMIRKVLDVIRPATTRANVHSIDSSSNMHEDERD